MLSLVGKKNMVGCAANYLEPLAYRDDSGNCRLCGQQRITRRHNCDALREIATPIAIQREKALLARQEKCPHNNLAFVSHEEGRCLACGAYVFVPDYDDPDYDD